MGTLAVICILGARKGLQGSSCTAGRFELLKICMLVCVLASLLQQSAEICQNSAPCTCGGREGKNWWHCALQTNKFMLDPEPTLDDNFEILWLCLFVFIFALRHFICVSLAVLQLYFGF